MDTTRCSPTIEFVWICVRDSLWRLCLLRVRRKSRSKSFSRQTSNVCSLLLIISSSRIVWISWIKIIRLISNRYSGLFTTRFRRVQMRRCARYMRMITLKSLIMQIWLFIRIRLILIGRSTARTQYCYGTRRRNYLSIHIFPGMRNWLRSRNCIKRRWISLIRSSMSIARSMRESIIKQEDFSSVIRRIHIRRKRMNLSTIRMGSSLIRRLTRFIVLPPPKKIKCMKETIQIIM